MNKFFIILLSIGILSSCGTSKDQTSKKTVVEETSEVSSTEGEIIETPAIEEEKEEKIIERSTYHGSATMLTDLIHTNLQVDFDWSKSEMNGVATLTCSPYFYATDSLILNAKAMEIKSVRQNGKELAYTYNDKRMLRIQLDKEYTRDAEYTVVIDYIAKPEEKKKGGSSAISSDKGLYFINPDGKNPNQMPQIWTQGETQANSVWFPTIDYTNQKMTQEIYMTVEDKYKTLSNGALVSSKENGDGTRTDHWKQDLPHAPYLAMMSVGEFEVVHDEYTKEDGTVIPVDYYVEPEWKEHAQAIFGETPEMIKFFADLFDVEYQWAKFHQIVVREYVSGAMENTGAVVFGDFVYKTKRELIDANDQSTIAHELFHHWFGDLVTCESWANLPLNESFANYSQYLWDEHHFGRDEADFKAEKEADGYFQQSSQAGYHDMIYFGYDEREDMNWFFNQWFLASRHPKLEISQESNEGKVTVYIEQTQDLDKAPLYKLPMKIGVYAGGKHITHEVVVDKNRNEFTFDFDGELENIVVDEDRVLLGKLDHDKPREWYVHQFYNAPLYKDREQAIKYGSRLRTDKGGQMIFDALDDDFWYIRKMAISKLSKLEDDQENEVYAKLKKMIKKDENSKVRGACADYLADHFLTGQRREEILSILENTIKNDRSYYALSRALTGLSKGKDKDIQKALDLSKSLESEKSSALKAQIISIYQNHGDASHLDFMANTIKNGDVSGYDVIGAVLNFTNALKEQDASTQLKYIGVFKQLSESGGAYANAILPVSLMNLKRGNDERITKLEKDIDILKEKEETEQIKINEEELAQSKELDEELKNLIGGE